jgi:subtilisin family serine protease/subtilase family serine protease
MSLRFGKALIALLLVAAGLTMRASAQAPGDGPFVGGEILVKFKPGVNADARADVHRVARGAAVDEIRRTGLHRIRVGLRNEAAALERYRRNPNVLYAERNVVRRIPAPLAHGGGTPVVPGDYHFAEQWALDNTGQGFFCFPWFGGEFCLYNGTPDADIDAPEAWSILRGSSVTVAVIDSGVDYTHPDLAAKYAGGYDFVFNDPDPMDDHGHGTHVAGTIAAAMDNPTGEPAAAEGVVGVAPNARFLAYKVCRSDGTCDDFALQQAIARAVADGANVINMSLGDPEFSQSLDDAVQDAWNAGVVIVAGAGNDGTTDRFYPAALDNVISVAAFDEDHRRPSFSNYGSWVDISAPGNAIMSTYPLTECTSTTTGGNTGCYTWNTGTSMASPHVAGAAALVWSRSDVITNSQVVDILLNSADAQGVSPVRLDSWTIHGGLNLHDAISYGLTNLPPQADAGADQTVADQDRDGAEQVTLDGSGSSDRDGSIATYEWREGDTSIGSGVAPVVSLAIGTHTLTLEVTDDGGESATDTVVVTVTPANQVSVTASSAEAAEAGPVNGGFTVSRTGDTSAPVTVQYTVSGAAVAGTDFVSLPGTVTIEAGSSSALVVVTPIDDTAFENNETVVLTLTAGAAYGLGSPTAATVTIVSDDLPPDLVVSSMSAPSTAAADADIVVTDTTRNQGTGNSPPSNTGFYLSTNATWDAADILLGSRSLAALGPGATHALPTTLHVPPATASGSYHVLAKADWDGLVHEGNEANNVRSSATVKIGPDLIVGAVSAPSSAVSGGTIGVSDTIKNQGGGQAAGSTTRFYWSANTSIDASDQVIGVRSVPPLAPGASSSLTTTLAVPAGAAVGTYYVIAQADAVNDVLETTESNNARSSAAVKVGPDLTVSAMSVPATGAAGAMIAVTETTKNQGAGTSAVSSTGFYLSTNSSLGAGDEFIGSRTVGELAPGGTGTASTMLLIPAHMAPGTYWVIGLADWNSAVVETAETNNDRADGPLRIGGDLVVASMSGPATVTVNSPITVTDSTRNQGLAPVPESRTAFYLSANNTYDATDTLLGDRLVGALGPSGSHSASTVLSLPPGTGAGSYFVIAVADANGAVIESLENNNTRATGVIRVGPDFIVTALTAPSSAVAGTSISASDTTKNQGVDSVPASVTSFYLSSNSTFDEADQFLASRGVSPLGPGLSEAGSVMLAIPVSTPAGSYYIIARSDASDATAEAQETNNNKSRAISISPSP